MLQDNFFDALAYFLEYPGPEAQPYRESMVRLLQKTDPEMLSRLQPFLEGLEELSITDREELYTRTFDINPTCSLEVGWQIYGETYDRGGFLVKMNAELRKYDIPPTLELSDHLPQMLRLFGRATPKRARDLAVGFLGPGIEKMLNAFTEASKENPYYHLLSATKLAVTLKQESIEAEECDVR